MAAVNLQQIFDDLKQAKDSLSYQLYQLEEEKTPSADAIDAVNSSMANLMADVKRMESEIDKLAIDRRKKWQM